MEQIINVTKTLETKPYWLAKGICKNHVSEIEGADILIVPLENFREQVSYAFNQGTTQLYAFLQKNTETEAFSVGLCADDENYSELALHANYHRIGKIVVTYIAAPFLVGLLTCYIYDILEAKPNEIVEASIIVQDSKCQGMKFDFKGNAQDFNKLGDDVKKFANICLDSSKKNE